MGRQGDFTALREPIELRLGGEAFHAPPVVSPATLAKLWSAGDRITRAHADHEADHEAAMEQTLQILDEVYARVLDQGSRSRFHERLFSETEPFDLNAELMPSLTWLIEEYSGRPTQPSPPSSTGFGDGSATSTSGAPAEASIPSTSPPTAFATSPTPPSTT